MSHQSGITVAQELRDKFGKANQSDAIRYIVCRIEEGERERGSKWKRRKRETRERERKKNFFPFHNINSITLLSESVISVKEVSSGSSVESDLNRVSSELTLTDARYVLFNKGGDGASWILMSHVPDQCKVKDKMLYASTRATVKRTLGANFFAEEMHGTLPADFNAAGYEQFKQHTAAAVPLTREEFHRQEELERGEIYSGGSSTYVHGVAFPAEAAVEPALKALVAGGKNYVALGVDTAKETITLRANKALASIDELRDQVSLNEPQFHFMRYVHESYDEIIFIFSCPDGSGKTTACPIKQRMLYSSSKARAVQLLEAAGGKVAKSFEFNEPGDVTQDDIDNALHPPKVEAAKQFSKPARPGRGDRKLIR